MAAKQNLQSQVDDILAKAEERGVQSNFFFVTTFKRYQVQMNKRVCERTAEPCG